MKALVIGGPKNGDWIETVDGAKVWLDIVHADTYVIRDITWTITDMKGQVVDAYRLYLAVHPQIVSSGQEQALAGQLLNLIAMTEFARAHGEQLETPKEPSPIVVPNNAAELFGPDGKPLA